MPLIEAIYQDGVFKPLAKVDLPENQRVTINVYPEVDKEDIQTWLARTQERHREFIEKHGYLPDSTPEIAEDRMRDI